VRVARIDRDFAVNQIERPFVCASRLVRENVIIEQGSLD
jgi:hypothetical protein